MSDYNKIYYQKHKEFLKAQAKKYYYDNLSAITIKTTNYRGGLRLDVIKKLGNYCKCCGESDSCFLAVDHINGGGHKEISELGRSKMYKKILESSNPFDEYQVLCHNCNSAKYYYKECPHQKFNVFTLRER